MSFDTEVPELGTIDFGWLVAAIICKGRTLIDTKTSGMASVHSAPFLNKIQVYSFNALV